MSTMYYTYPEKKQIGQVHSLGKGKGYHFTWCMFPMEFAEEIGGILKAQQEWIIDEYGMRMDFFTFQNIIEQAVSQSFDERIE